MASKARKTKSTAKPSRREPIAPKAPKGAWDNGKANIWETPFSPALWRFDGASVRCHKAR